MGGATDFNRYLSAAAADAAGERGFHRIYAGGHSDPPPWIRDEAMTWLNGRYLQAKKTDRNFADERLDWEASMLAWLLGKRECLQRDSAQPVAALAVITG